MKQTQATKITKGLRRIPAVMATQHPDNANAPYWEVDGDGFISAQEEVREAFSAYSDLGVDEYMWDWEGKYVDEAVVERLFSEYTEFFQQHVLGRDRFLTFRIPNIWEEKGYSLARAFMGMLTAADMAHDLKMPAYPLFEVILPMTKNPEQLMYLHDTFQKLAKVKHELFAGDTADFDHIEMIPLTESVPEMLNIRGFLESYEQSYKKAFKKQLRYLRPFIARSDPALVSGMLAAVIGNKVALSEMARWSKKSGVPIYPIIGAGSLPFRGGLSPEYIDQFINEYQGVRTVTIQSAFRYDYPLKTVRRALKKLQQELPSSTPRLIDEASLAVLGVIAERSAKLYRKTIAGIADDVLSLSKHVPRRRERKLHIGLLKYGRSVAGKEFPRAITFTATLYSLGVPPELIAAGRTIAMLSDAEKAVFEKTYIHFKDDMIRAGRYLNTENVLRLSAENAVWEQIHADIVALEAYLGVTLGPKTTTELLHRNATSDVYLLMQKNLPIADVLLRAATLRQSLG